MFRIRQVDDDTTLANRQAIANAQDILRTQFPGVDESDIEKIPQELVNPLKHRFRASLLIAEKTQNKVVGMALLLHAPDLNFVYLEYIATAPGITGGGIGGALYERVRETAYQLDAVGVFFECLPDDPNLCGNEAIRKQNASRLRFYERYGARPIAHTAYETPLTAGGDNPPYLVLDQLSGALPLRRDQARKIVRAILERKYGHMCSKEYNDMVVNSIKDDPVCLRPPRYLHTAKTHEKKAVDKTGATAPVMPVRERRIALAINDKHSIHHVRERGYVESPVRIGAILRELGKTILFERVKTDAFGLEPIKAVHDSKYVSYFKRACSNVPQGKSIYPSVFPIRNTARPPKDLPLRAGYYCIDTFTPLNENAYLAARGAVDCALTCAEYLLSGYHFAYGLVRPPGHHAESKSFGGFCYFNSSAVAANYLSQFGKVVVLDIDYHHGNGTQDIFYRRADVFTVSLHGHPRYTYPYFSGFEDEKGEAQGLGYNLNIPLPENLNGSAYREHLSRALRAVGRFKPKYLVLALGLDTAKGDPTGSFTLTAEDFRLNGELIGRLRLPTLVMQEGGYLTRSLGINARNFFQGLWQGSHQSNPPSPPTKADHARPKKTGHK
jgi:acetoin utilization deacetylase AcuC-like enzyme/GNAT superfamily N-acetyltransferase